MSEGPVRLPEISVLVPIYNVERYLAECLDSLVAQTFTDFEVILINDGSTDGSRDIMTSLWARMWPSSSRTTSLFLMR